MWDRLAGLFTSHPVVVRRPYGDVVVEPGWHWKVVLPDHDLWSVVRGRGRAEVTASDTGVTQMVALGPGSTLVLRPGDRVWAVHDPAEPLQVCFTHYRMGESSPPPELQLPRVVVLADRAGTQERLRTLVRWCQRDGEAGRARAGLELASVLLACHRQLAEQAGVLPPPLDPRLGAVVDRVRAHPAERLTLEQAAALARLSADVFSRRFSAEVGETFRTFCVRVRIERARDLLSSTGLTVTEVARALGYADHRLFVRQFRHWSGQSPGVWRGGGGPR